MHDPYMMILFAQFWWSKRYAMIPNFRQYADRLSTCSKAFSQEESLNGPLFCSRTLVNSAENDGGYFHLPSPNQTTLFIIFLVVNNQKV